MSQIRTEELNVGDLIWVVVQGQPDHLGIVFENAKNNLTGTFDGSKWISSVCTFSHIPPEDPNECIVRVEHYHLPLSFFNNINTLHKKEVKPSYLRIKEPIPIQKYERVQWVANLKMYDDLYKVICERVQECYNLLDSFSVLCNCKKLNDAGINCGYCNQVSCFEIDECVTDHVDTNHYCIICPNCGDYFYSNECAYVLCNNCHKNSLSAIKEIDSEETILTSD